ncbi:MAG: glycosyltransferase, partial [Advenella sp.]
VDDTGRVSYVSEANRTTTDTKANVDVATQSVAATESGAVPQRGATTEGASQPAVAPDGTPQVGATPARTPQSGTTPAAGAQAQTEARKQLCAMGRFVATKRFEMLIDVFGRLAPDVPDWDLTIWGEGPLHSLLQDKVRKLGLQERIHLPGKTDQPWEAISRADAFVMTSEVEGFPNVLLESMALGLPCVTMDCPSGPAELSRDGRDAILVGLSDVEGLQEALYQIMTDEILRRELGHRATISVRDRYSLAAVLEQWQFLFDAVLGRSRIKPEAPTRQP